MKLSIIIVSWRVKELLKQCLKSIFNQLTDLDFEVIVVDNDSGDGTVEMVTENFPQIQLIKSQLNLGFARAVNLAIKKAQGNNLLLLNPDTKLIDNSLIKSLEYMKSNPQTGVLGCQLLNYDQTIQPSVRNFPRFIDHFLMIFRIHHLFKLKRYLALDFDYQKISEVDQVMGAFFLISRKVIDKIGLFDSKYYIWFEEVDYCQRVKKAGFKIIYFPLTKIIHYGGQSFKQVVNYKNHLVFCKSRLRYLYKHQSFFGYLIILIFTPISLFLSLFSFKNAN